MSDSKFNLSGIFGDLLNLGSPSKKNTTAPSIAEPKAKTGSVFVLVSSDGNVEIHGEFKSLTINGKMVRFTKPL